MQYHCTWCDYIYDELTWDDDLGVPPHTYFENLPNDFFCPVCDTHRDDFTLFDEEIHYPINRENLTPIEAKHFPEYEIVWDVLHYHISENHHLSDENHFIYKIVLFDETWDEILTHLFESWDKVKGIFDIDYLDDFELRVYCSKEWVFSTGKIQRKTT